MPNARRMGYSAGEDGREKLTFVNQDQAQVVPGRVFLIDFSEGRRQIESAQEEPNGNGFS